MSIHILSSVCAIGALCCALPAHAILPTTPTPWQPGEVLVKYRQDAGAVPSKAEQRGRGFTVRAELLDGRAQRLQLPAIVDVPEALQMLRADPRVEYAEPNYLRRPSAFTPNDPDFADQWGIQNTGQANFIDGGPAGNAGGDLHLIQAWDQDGDGTPDHTGTGAVTVAIVDDGFELTHEDLAANFVAGYDFQNNDADPSPDSTSDSHGTSVSGCVGAIGNNAKGVAGAIWNVKLMPLKFGYDVASEIAALEYARTHGAEIVNASFGGGEYSQAESDEIAKLGAAGILFIASAGNEYSNTDLAGAAYPANYRLSNVMGIAATNRQDDIASFSNYGGATVDVAAPGLQIVTTTVGNGYTAKPGVSGTSFSSPYTAGVAALIEDYVSGASASEVRARLVEGADAGVDSANPANLRAAGGRVNAANSLTLAARPALVIDPVNTDHYTLQDGSGTQVPVFRPVSTDDLHYGVLVPGANVNLTITLRNLWQDAAEVSGTLSASGGSVTVNSGAVSFGTLPNGATGAGTFNLSVPTTAADHQYVALTLSLSANAGAYSASRHLILDLGQLANGAPVTQSIGVGLQDSFHTWEFDVPAGSTSVTFQSSAGNDIDLIVSQGTPAQYQIELNAPSTTTNPLYFASVPPAQIGGATKTGTETVTVNDPQAGPWFVTVVNYDLTANASYTLKASASSAPPVSGDGGSHHSGALTPALIGPLLALAAWRRRRFLCRAFL